MTVPASAVDGAQNTTTVTVTSVAGAAVSGNAALVTQAVTKDWLLVDEDGNNPDDVLPAGVDSSGRDVL